MSQYMIEILTSEVDRFTKNKDKFLSKFSLDDFDYIRSGWLEKTGRVRDGDQVVKDLLVDVFIWATSGVSKKSKTAGFYPTLSYPIPFYPIH